MTDEAGRDGMGITADATPDRTRPAVRAGDVTKHHVLDGEPASRGGLATILNGRDSRVEHRHVLPTTGPDPSDEPIGKSVQVRDAGRIRSVSYTHLTLPTICSV